MKTYQALSRRYRPQRFQDVLGQQAPVQALSNSVSRQRVGHAYLFAGSRGTGKTTLARILAKAINCEQRAQDQPEPCNHCTSCHEISTGVSLDVLEIDGASHRGIDDIRRLSESAPYAAPHGKAKVYIIDEVHMLTKEAFNALLKTLEEPPNNVKFFFATTEPERVPATILSRCQRFHLTRIPSALVADKLAFIAKSEGISADLEALQMIAAAADGALRDAECMLDQALSFQGDQITSDSVATSLGLLPKSRLFQLDQAVAESRVEVGFTLAEELFSNALSCQQFVCDLVQHYRTLLLLKLGSQSLLDLSEESSTQYQRSAAIYRKEQILAILDDVVETSEAIHTSPLRRFGLEMLLTRIIRSTQRIPLEVLTQRLVDLEKTVQTPPLEPLRDAQAKPPKQQEGAPQPSKQPASAPEPEAGKAARSTPAPSQDKQQKSQVDYNTAIRFAAVELEGSVES